MRLPKIILAALLLCSSAVVFTSPTAAQSKNSPIDKFRQLEEILPTPNEQRTGSGAPGHKYWQQKADYVMDVELDDKNQRLIGSETITYYNNSPDTLTYLWLQLDQNHFRQDSDAKLTQTAPKNLNNLPPVMAEGLARQNSGRAGMGAEFSFGRGRAKANCGIHARGFSRPDYDEFGIGDEPRLECVRQTFHRAEYFARGRAGT